MFKPPFMSEGDALLHSVRWIQEVSQLSDEVSINPMNIQKRTIVDRLHRNREYRPPWLWSLVKMIQDSHNAVKESGCRVIVHPTAGGKIRGRIIAVNATRKLSLRLRGTPYPQK